jgi:cell division protein FtsI/penicillin-binding protein 2
LTIDLDIENKVREVLASEKYKDFNNIGVTIMEADTGKIKAMVQKDESEANVNLGIEGNGYEPGSVFKLITLASALDKGLVTMNDKYTCTGKICGLGIHGTQTVEQALLNSCNDVYAAVGEKVGYVTMMDYCKKLGLFSKVLNVTAPRQNETEGIAPDIEDGMANISIGQCMTLSPLQMLGATNAIVNGGEYIKPYLLEAILDKDDNIVKEYSTKKERIIRIISIYLKYFGKNLLK